MTPFFSVIITVFNKQNYVKDTINSVLKQTFCDYELIIINDGSTDNSLELINEFKDDQIYIIDQENLGVSIARNNGLAVARGEFIALLDGDDLWDKDYLKIIKQNIGFIPHQSVFSTAIAHLYKNNRIAPAIYNFRHKEPVKILDYFRNSLKQQILTSSSIVFKRTIIDKIGFFDSSLKSGEDIDYWIRIASHYKIVFINKILVYYRYDDESLSNTAFDLSLKPKYDNFKELESNNFDAKKYINKNRYSLALMSNLYNDQESFQFYSSTIEKKFLNRKQNFLLKSPAWLLKVLLKVKSLNGEKLYYRPLKSKKS